MKRAIKDDRIFKLFHAKNNWVLITEQVAYAI